MQRIEDIRFTLKPVSGRGFVNREKILGEMYAELSDPRSNTGYAIHGKRRVGKTSIFKEIILRLTKTKDIVPVYLSVWDLVEPNLQEFCQKLTAEIIDSHSEVLGLRYKARELLQAPISMLKKLLAGAKFKVLYEELELSVSLGNAKADKNLLVERAFNLPERISKSTKCILFIDEFPSLIRLKSGNSMIGEGIIGKIRTLSEGWRKTVLCVSGSIRSTMDLAVLSSSSPFYRQLVAREIGAMEKESVAEILRNAIPGIPYAAIEEICRFTGGIPFYVQFLGKALQKEKDITADTVKHMEKNFFEEEGDILFREELAALSPKERAVAAALAGKSLFPSEVVEHSKENMSNVSRFLSYLEDKGFVSKSSAGKYALEDPVFDKWLWEKLH